MKTVWNGDYHELDAEDIVSEIFGKRLQKISIEKMKHFRNIIEDSFCTCNADNDLNSEVYIANVLEDLYIVALGFVSNCGFTPNKNGYGLYRVEDERCLENIVQRMPLLIDWVDDDGNVHRTWDIKKQEKDIGYLENDNKVTPIAPEYR